MSQLLIKSVDELRAHVPFAKTEKGWSKVAPVVLVTQEKYIKRQLCTDLYQQLLDYADPLETSGSASASASGSGSASASGSSSSSSSSTSTTVTDAWLEKLLQKVRGSLAFLTLFEGFGLLEVQFGSDGIHRVEGQEVKSIYSGQRESAMRTLQKLGFEQLETMILFMEENASKYPAWTASTCYTVHKKRVVRSAIDFSKIWTKMGESRLTYNALLSIMQEVEEDSLLEILGAELHAEWFEERAADNMSAENTALLSMMQRIVVYQTVAEALPELSLQIEAYGVFTPLLSGNEKNVQELSKADAKRFNDVRDRYSEKADRWKNKLRDFLNANYTDYPLYDYDENDTQNTGSLPDQDENPIVGF